jgi:hypothetical protein
MAQTAKLMRPIDAASGDHNGEPFVLNPNDLYRADDELVTAYPHLFKEAKQTRPEVEQATASPGEKRGSSRR